MKSRILSLFVLVLLTGCSSDVQEKPNPEIVSKLQEIIEVRQTQLKREQLLAELGKGKIQDFVTNSVGLADARSALAKEQGQIEIERKELSEIVNLIKKRIARESALAEEDRRTATELGELRIALLEAELRVLRAKENK